MKKEMPYMPFCSTQWLANPHIRGELTPAQRGYLIDLLCLAHLDGDAKIPKDTKKLSKFLRISERNLIKNHMVWIEVFFKIDTENPDFYYSPWLKPRNSKAQNHSNTKMLQIRSSIARKK
jgi:hypothetical protein